MWDVLIALFVYIWINLVPLITVSTLKATPCLYYNVVQLRTSMVQRFLFSTYSELQKENKYKKSEKGGGYRIYNPKGLD